MRRQHPERRDQDALGLLLAYWSSAPALAYSPLAHAPLQADDVPDEPFALGRPTQPQLSDVRFLITVPPLGCRWR